MAKDFNTILSEAQQIKNEIIEGANTALRTGTCLEDIVQRAESDEGLAAKKARTITAGNGLTGGGSLATDMELTVGNTDDSIVVGADGIKVDTQDSLTSTSITKPLSAAKGKALQDTKANKTVTIEAGNGLTGGGDLSGNRTLNIESATDGITPNADNIQLNTIDALDSTSATKPLSANQGKVLNEKVVQVETDLNIKNAEQDASIKSIEQLLSQSNLNQTAQVSSSGREIVSLPKTASNGGMEIKLEGLTAQNLINGKNIAIGGSVTFATLLNNKYYVSNQPIIVLGDGNNYSSTNYGTTVINIIVIDLTATFGAGNEPSLATCDAMFSTYFDGTKSFIPTGRVRSVGKNAYKPFPNANLKTIDGEEAWLVNSHIIQYKGFLPNTVYYVGIRSKHSGFAGRFKIGYTDGTFDYSIYNSATFGNVAYTTTIGKTVKSIEWVQNPGINTSYIARNSQYLYSRSKPLIYEPYIETNLYLTAPDLKSNGLVKDEIRKGQNGYELVKKVGVGTLGEEKVLNGGFDSTDNWTVPSDRANITNGTLNIDVTSWGIDVSQFMSFTAGKWYFVKFNVTNVVRGGILYIYGVDNAIPISVNSIKEYTFVMKASTTKYNTLKINSANIAISIDNVSVKEITTSDGDLTGTTAVIYDTNINYTLATPIVTPIEHAGVINSAESGTVYHEPVLADAAIYGTNISILNTTYPISALEEIMVHTNVDTYLDVSKAVIASDGLSFTHPDLRAGDLVLFTYFFSKEKVNGLITATYYDGRYVIADTADGKFYKWGVKSTNGVATIQLTEV